MMTDWEQVEYLMTKGYYPEPQYDGWVKFAGPHSITHFSPERWAAIDKMLKTPPMNRPHPFPPPLTPEQQIAARNAALDARPRSQAYSAPRLLPPPSMDAQEAEQDDPVAEPAAAAPKPSRRSPPARPDPSPLPLF